MRAGFKGILCLPVTPLTAKEEVDVSLPLLPFLEIQVFIHISAYLLLGEVVPLHILIFFSYTSRFDLDSTQFCYRFIHKQIEFLKPFGEIGIFLRHLHYPPPSHLFHCISG